MYPPKTHILPPETAAVWPARAPGEGPVRVGKLDVRLPEKRQFKLPWREAGPPNHHDDKVEGKGPRVSASSQRRSSFDAAGSRISTYRERASSLLTTNWSE